MQIAQCIYARGARRQHIADNVRNPSTGEVGILTRTDRNEYQFRASNGAQQTVSQEWAYSEHERTLKQAGLSMPSTKDAVLLSPDYERIAEDVAYPIGKSSPLLSRGVLIFEQQLGQYLFFRWDGTIRTVPQGWARSVHQGNPRMLTYDFQVVDTGVDFSQDAHLRDSERSIAESACSRTGDDQAEGLLVATNMRLFFMGGRHIESYPWFNLRDFQVQTGLGGKVELELVAADTSSRSKTARFESEEDDFWYVLSAINEFCNRYREVR